MVTVLTWKLKINLLTQYHSTSSLNLFSIFLTRITTTTTKNSLLSGQVCYRYTTVAADFLLEQECSKLEHGMINMPQIEGGEGYYSFRDGLRQRWVKDHCFFVLFFFAQRVN